MSERTRAYLILLFMPLFFSSNLVIGRAALNLVEPWTLGFWRWTLASILLLPLAWPGLRAHARELSRHWKLILMLGFLGMVLCGGGVYAALKHTTATNGTLIYTTSPVFVLILEVVFRGQRASLRQVAGIAFALTGVAVIVMHGDLERLLRLELNPGDIGMAFASFAWAIYSVLLRARPLQVFPTRSLFFVIAATGAILLLPFMVLESFIVGPVPLSGPAWGGMVAIAIFSSILPFLSYQYGVKIVGPTITSVFLYLLPVYGVLMAVVFLGEEFHAYHVAGFVLVMAGVVLATAPFGRRTVAKAA